MIMSENKNKEILPIFVCKYVISNELSQHYIAEIIENINTNLEIKLSGQYNVIVTITKNGVPGDLQFELYNIKDYDITEFNQLRDELLKSLNHENN